MLGSKLGITDHTPILQLEKLVQDEGGFKPNHTLLIYPMFIFDFSSLQLHPSTPRRNSQGNIINPLVYQGV